MKENVLRINEGRKIFNYEESVCIAFICDKFPQDQSEGLGGPRLPRPSKTPPYRLREY